MNLPDALETRIAGLDILADQFAIDRERLRLWGIVHAVWSACWSLEDHEGGWEEAITVAELLDELGSYPHADPKPHGCSYTVETERDWWPRPTFN
jgi:hypothetical protein